MYCLIFSFVINVNVSLSFSEKRPVNVLNNSDVGLGFSAESLKAKFDIKSIQSYVS